MKYIHCCFRHAVDADDGIALVTGKFDLVLDARNALRQLRLQLIEVIFKKYSPMGDLGEFAGQICESIGKNTGYIAAVCDRDAIIAVHGVQKRELLDKRCSQELEQLMELRRSYRYQDGDLPVRPTDASDRYRVGAAAPIVTEGDLMGCVLLLSEDGAPALGEAEQRLVQTVAGFLGRQMES